AGYARPLMQRWPALEAWSRDRPQPPIHPALSTASPGIPGERHRDQALPLPKAALAMGRGCDALPSPLPLRVRRPGTQAPPHEPSPRGSWAVLTLGLAPQHVEV